MKKYKKITIFLFVAILALTALTACTGQAVSEEAAPTAAVSSESQTEAEKDCCHEKAESGSKPDCCKEESTHIPDCCEN